MPQGGRLDWAQRVCGEFGSKCCPAVSNGALEIMVECRQDRALLTSAVLSVRHDSAALREIDWSYWPIQRSDKGRYR